MRVVFDKLLFVQRLEGPDRFTRPQAEALSEVFRQAVSESVATKADVEASRVAVKADIEAVRTDLQRDFAALKEDTGVLRSDIAVLRSDIKASIAETKVWTVSIGASIIAVLAATKYFG